MSNGRAEDRTAKIAKTAKTGQDDRPVVDRDRAALSHADAGAPEGLNRRDAEAAEILSDRTYLGFFDARPARMTMLRATTQSENRTQLMARSANA